MIRNGNIIYDTTQRQQQQQQQQQQQHPVSQPARSISYTPKHCLATPDTTAPAPPDGSA